MTQLRVLEVLPARRQVPANTARVHLTFSEPMLPGTVGRHVCLQNTRGVARWYLGTQERWNLDRTRLTFELAEAVTRGGAGNDRCVLREGEYYTLEVGVGVLAATGAALEAPALHVFLAGAPMHDVLAPHTWKVALPEAGSRDPLVVAFPHPMDLLGLERLIRVVDPEGRILRGAPGHSANMTTWSWEPRRAWQPGAHALRLDPDLRDVCGNNLVSSARDADQEQMKAAAPTDLNFRVKGPQVAPTTKTPISVPAQRDHVLTNARRA